MKKELINTIEQGMLGILNNEQLAKLHEVLEFSFAMFAENYEETQYSNDELLKLFLCYPDQLNYTLALIAARKRQCLQC